jgi:hypothetical protein
MSFAPRVAARALVTTAVAPGAAPPAQASAPPFITSLSGVAMSRRWAAPVVALVVALLAGLTATVLTPVTAYAAVADVWAYAFMDKAAPPPDWKMDPDHQAGTYRATCADWGTVTSPVVGRYDISFPCSATTGGIVHVTTVDSAGRFCQAGSWGPAGSAEAVRVFCFDAAGVAATALFTVLFTRSSGTVAAGGHGYVSAAPSGMPLTSFNSSGGANGIFHPRAGVYQVVLPGLAPQPGTGNVQATAVESTGLPRRCRVADSGGSGTLTSFMVYCSDAAGTDTDSAFTLSYHESRTVYGGATAAATAGILVASGAPAGTNFNSAGTPNTALRVATGAVDVTFGRVAAGIASHVQVTAFGGTPVYCQLTNLWAVSGVSDILAHTACFRAGGAPADGQFSAAYVADA